MSNNSTTEIILGIDPGSLKTGYGVLEFNRKNREIAYLESGLIDLRSYPNKQKRLSVLFTDLQTLKQHYKIDVITLEQIFVGKNINSAMKLGEARGIPLLFAGLDDICLAEFSATQIKSMITGNGRATKEQINFMVKKILKLNINLQEDAADALASAICYTRNIVIVGN